MSTQIDPPTREEVPPCLNGARHQIDVIPPEPVPVCTVCGVLVSNAVGRELFATRGADFSRLAAKWFDKSDEPRPAGVVSVSLTPHATHYSNDERCIHVVHRVRDAFGFERDSVVAKIHSSRVRAEPFSIPTIRFLGDDGGMIPSFTRAQWEALKREGDEAFDAFERSWPADAAAPDGDRLVCTCPRDDPRDVILAKGVAIHRRGCPRFGLVP